MSAADKLIAWLAEERHRVVVLGQGTYEDKWCWCCILRKNVGKMVVSNIKYEPTADAAIEAALKFQ